VPTIRRPADLANSTFWRITSGMLSSSFFVFPASCHETPWGLSSRRSANRGGQPIGSATAYQTHRCCSLSSRRSCAARSAGVVQRSTGSDATSGHQWNSEGVGDSLMVLKPFQPAQVVAAVSSLLAEA
jgi:hypothetical protein